MTDKLANVIIYTTRFCPYCMRVRRLLKKKGIKFEEIRVGGNPDLWEEMEKRSGRNTVPQVFINEESVGGYDDIALLDQQNKLDVKLRLS